MDTVFTAVVILGIIIGWIQLIKLIIKRREQWKENYNLPLIVVKATIVGKRERECLHTGTTGKITTFMSYYAMFEFENRDRKEFSIRLPEYILIVEGDFVRLSLKGTRYIKLEKIV